MKSPDNAPDIKVGHKTPEEIMEILDMLQFFGGQRAGRELWADKPKEVQDADIESFNGKIKAIREYIQQLESDKQQLEGLCNHMNQLRDAAAGRALKMEERVHQLEAERDAAVEAMPRWISVDERLPEVGVNVIVLLADGFTSVAQRLTWGWFIYVYSSSRDVTHWMPLPETPKEAKHE